MSVKLVQDSEANFFCHCGKWMAFSFHLVSTWFAPGFHGSHTHAQPAPAHARRTAARHTQGTRRTRSHPAHTPLTPPLADAASAPPRSHPLMPRFCAGFFFQRAFSRAPKLFAYGAAVRFWKTICECAAASRLTIALRAASSETASPRRQRASCDTERTSTGMTQESVWLV